MDQPTALEAVIAGALDGLPLVQRQAQAVQTAHRARIAAAWGVLPGMRILELGCGQGDMTAVLATMVGSSGQVVAVDPGSPDYGAPLTLGEATAMLKSGPLGPRIQFRLGAGALEQLPPARYDAVALAHCGWYFANADALQSTFGALRSRSDRLLLSEWDIRADLPGQLPHFLAVLLRRALNNPAPDDNIRTPLFRSEMIAILDAASWRVEETASIDSADLQDGCWEMDLLLTRLLEDPTLGSAGLIPDREIAALRAMILASGAQSMPSYALSCTRA